MVPPVVVVVEGFQEEQDAVQEEEVGQVEVVGGQGGGEVEDLDGEDVLVAVAAVVPVVVGRKCD